VITSLFKKREIPAKLFESKIAHGKTSTAETLNQIPAGLVRLMADIVKEIHKRMLNILHYLTD